MTRFARAKGSKSSNERVPEEATSWEELKRQLLESNNNAEDKIKRREAIAKRNENYDNFMNENEAKTEYKWAEFPSEATQIQKSRNKRKLSDDEESSNDDQPEEQSSKVQLPEIKIKKKKLKKTNVKMNKFDSEINGGCSENEKSEVKAIKEKKDCSNLTEKDLKKIEKKKQKRLKQLEKKKQNKSEIRNKVEGKDAIVTEESGKTKKPTNENVTNSTISTPNKFDKETEKTSKPYARRKAQVVNKITVNGKDIDITYFDGFPIKKEDADRIGTLKKELTARGVPKSEINFTIKLERRKAEKALAREKKKVCFNCRKSGHNLSECPDVGKSELIQTSGTGLCFKCGSTEHTHFECRVVRGEDYKFATCFICNEQGHISRQCPDNARGLYPKGGACRICGDVTHLKKDCPQFQAQQERGRINVGTYDGSNPDVMDGFGQVNCTNNTKPVNKIIKF